MMMNLSHSKWWRPNRCSKAVTSNNFAKWVNEHLIYPEDAQKAKKQGRVVVQFTITKTGKMENVKVLRGNLQILG